MALIGAHAHKLLCTHLNSSLARDSQAPSASQNVTFGASTRLNFPAMGVMKLVFQDTSATLLAGHGVDSYNQRCRVYSARDSSPAATSSLEQVTSSRSFVWVIRSSLLVLSNCLMQQSISKYCLTGAVVCCAGGDSRRSRD